MMARDLESDVAHASEQPSSRLEWLMSGYFDSDLNDCERQELRRELLSSPVARQMFWQMARLRVALHLWAGEVWGKQAAIDESVGNSEPAAPESRAVGSSHRLPPLAATIAACALCLGVGAGAAWAFVPVLAQPFSRLIPVLHEGFEKPLEQPASAPSFEPRSRLPASFGYWSGDRVAITRKTAAISPSEGNSMLVFAEALNDPLSPDTAMARSCDLYRLIDLLPYQHLAVQGQAVLHLSASFCNAAAPADTAPSPSTRFTCRVRLFDGSIADVVNDWPRATEYELAGGGVLLTVPPEGSAGDWHKVDAKVLIPPNATFAIVHIAASPGNERGSDPSDHFPYRFPSAFCDDLRVNLVVQEGHSTAALDRP